MFCPSYHPDRNQYFYFMKNLFILTILINMMFSHQCLGADSLKTNKRHTFSIFAKTKYYTTQNSTQSTLINSEYMDAKNTFGYEIGLNYEYENRKHVTYTTTLNYGIQKHDLGWEFNMNEYAPQFSYSDPILEYSEKFTNKYLLTSFLIGYNYHPSNKRVTIQGKGGIGLLAFLNSLRGNYNNTVTIKTDNNNYVQKTIATDYALLGPSNKENFLDATPTLEDNYITVHLYLGLKYKFRNNRLFQALLLGIDHSQVLPTKDNDAGIYRSTYYDYNGSLLGRELYNNKFRSVSLLVGLEF